jgi:hypothetical protein
VVEPADARERDHVAALGALDRSPRRCIAVERHVRTVVVVEADVVSNEPEQVPLAEDDDVVEQLASDRPDEPLGKAVLPGRARRDPELLEAHAKEPLFEHGAEDPIAIADDALGDDVGRYGLDHLLRRPRGVGMRGDVDVQYAPPLEREHEEDVQHAERCGLYGEEIDGERARQVIAHERAPRLRRRTRPRSASRHVPRHRVLADDVPELGEFARDATPAPRRVFPNHPHDELDDGGVERWAARATRPPGPEADEAATMPADDGLRLHEHEGVRPPRPRAREHDPERAVDGAQPRSWRGATKNGELLPQSEVLRDEARAGPKGGHEGRGDRGEQSYHGLHPCPAPRARHVAATVARTGEDRRVAGRPRHLAILFRRGRRGAAAISSWSEAKARILGLSSSSAKRKRERRLVPEAHARYSSFMAAKVSPRVQHIVEEAAELPPDELAELIEAIKSLPRREEAIADRHAVIAERVARVQSGSATTLSVDEVEASLRRDLDF